MILHQQTRNVHGLKDALAEKLGVIRQTVNTWISDIRARQKTSRNTVILRLSRLGWPHEKISETVGINQQRISQITNNADFGNIGNLLAQGRNMEYIARHYNMDLALVWALRLEEKTDQEKFKELGWGLRTWDQWNFNECDERFGDDWPGRIPAQKRQMRIPLPYHPIQRRSMRGFLKASSYWPIENQKKGPGWPS